MQRSWIIHIDTREQAPLPIPTHLPFTDLHGNPCTLSITILRTSLKTRDYCLDSDIAYECGGTSAQPRCLAVERKLSIDELTSNVRTPAFTRCLDRLALFDLPILLLESPTSALTIATSRSPYPPGTLDSLLRLLIPRHISLWLIPAKSSADRIAVGSLLARALINTALLSPPPSSILPLAPSLGA